MGEVFLWTSVLHKAFSALLTSQKTLAFSQKVCHKHGQYHIFRGASHHTCHRGPSATFFVADCYCALYLSCLTGERAHSMVAQIHASQCFLGPHTLYTQPTSISNISHYTAIKNQRWHYCASFRKKGEREGLHVCNLKKTLEILLHWMASQLLMTIILFLT